MVVMSIVSIMTAIFFPSYRSGQSQYALSRSANKLSQDIRQAEEMAISAEETNGSVPEGGYGIYLNSDNLGEYFFFADENGSQSYDEGEKIGNNIFFEEQTEIKNFLPSENSLTIIFQPPEPLVIINGDTTIQSASVVIGNNDNTETITVNKAGLIYVE